VAGAGMCCRRHFGPEAGNVRGPGRVRAAVQVAADAATLDILAPGRVPLGLGAGHTPREWADIGRRRPAAGERAARLAGFVDAVAGLLQGDTVTREDPLLTLRGSRLDGLPVGGNVEIVVGGGHPEVLRAAARRALREEHFSR
jgi:alkanesulfonate monooxygenase SsuD/methylene tetrahydromethanopterin reductase-like flavin-dependent oxidoreductase (luciferase family)